METDNQDKQKKKKSKRTRQELVTEGAPVEAQSQPTIVDGEAEAAIAQEQATSAETLSEPQAVSETPQGGDAGEGQVVATESGEVSDAVSPSQEESEADGEVLSGETSEVPDLGSEEESPAPAIVEDAASGQAIGENVEETPGSEGISNDQIIEAVLFSSDTPLPASKIASVIGALSAREIRATVERLNANYQRCNCAFHIQEIAGGFQMLTRPEYANYLRQLYKVRAESKLSPASLETLAIIAYKQPVLRAEIEAIRGVACGEMIRTLMEKDLIKIVGRAEELGRPMLYGTTKRFMQVFGLASLDDLPKVPELLPPSRPVEPAKPPEETKKPSEPQPSESAASASSDDEAESKS